VTKQHTITSAAAEHVAALANARLILERDVKVAYQRHCTRLTAKIKHLEADARDPRHPKRREW